MARTKTKIDNSSSNYLDIILEFNNIKLFVLVEPDTYTNSEIQKIENTVAIMSKRIFIDKSYVDFPENKHKDVFIEYNGWKNLCKLLKKTKYCKEMSSITNNVLNDTFKVIVIAYIYHVLEIFGYDIENISVDFMLDCELSVKFHKDTVKEWKYYPGPWQDWGLDDNEHQKKV